MKNKLKYAFSFEKKFIKFINNNIIFIYFIVACIVLCFVRINFLDYRSGDYNSFLLPWYNEIYEGGGFSTLSENISNYNVLYMYLFTALTYLPLDPLYSVKILSIIFDFLCGIGCALLIYQLDGRTYKAYTKSLFAFIIVLMLPTVILNSSAWAQCDSVYTSCIIFSLYYLVKQKYIPSMIWFSLSFCFKLQAIFILPIFLILYFTEKRFSILTFMIIPLTFTVVAIPAMLMGRPLIDIINIYLDQIDLYKRLTLNYPNIYSLIPNQYELIVNFGKLMTIFIFGTCATYIIAKKIHITGKRVILLSLWSVMTCVLFLPSMHERYAYIADILSVVYFIVISKKVIIPILINFVSLMAYMPFLFGEHMIDMKILAVLNLIAYFIITKEFIEQLNRKYRIRGVLIKGSIKVKDRTITR